MTAEKRYIIDMAQQRITTNDDPDSMLESAAELARALIPNVDARINDLKDQLAKAMDQRSRLEQIERIASGASQVELPAGVILKSRRRVFVDPADVPPEEESDKDAATTKEDINAVLELAAKPLTVAEIKDWIESKFERKRATSTLYNYLGKGKTDGLYQNDDTGWSLTDKGREALSLA